MQISEHMQREVKEGLPSLVNTRNAEMSLISRIENLYMSVNRFCSRRMQCTKNGHNKTLWKAASHRCTGMENPPPDRWVEAGDPEASQWKSEFGEL